MAAKLTRQQALISEKLKNVSAANVIAELQDRLSKVETIDAVRTKAQAASEYWAAWREAPILFPRIEPCGERPNLTSTKSGGVVEIDPRRAWQTSACIVRWEALHRILGDISTPRVPTPRFSLRETSSHFAAIVLVPTGVPIGCCKRSRQMLTWSECPRAMRGSSRAQPRRSGEASTDVAIKAEWQLGSECP